MTTAAEATSPPSGSTTAASSPPSSSSDSGASSGHVSPLEHTRSGTPLTSEDENDDEDNWYTTEYKKELPAIPDAGRFGAVDADKGTPDAWVQRDDRLIRLTGKHPLNCEAPLTDLWKSGFLTPTSLFYVRNHGYVPQVTDAAAASWELRIHGVVHRECSFTIADLKRLFPTVTLPITLVCAGNRRKEQNMVQKGGGFHWGAAGVSTALWTGVYLADVLDYCRPRRPVGAYPYNDPTPGRARHVIFEGIDELPNGKYGTSQRLAHCLDKNKGMLIAWGMNGEALSPDHGFPLRLVTGGQIGGRMVKWLNRIEVSDIESQHHLHFHDNKVLPTTVTVEQARSQEHWWKDDKYILYDLNCNAAICEPAHEEVLQLQTESSPAGVSPEEYYEVQGYAYTGGGKRMSRVELCFDDQGDKWQLAELSFPEDLYRSHPIRDHPYFGTLDLSRTEASLAWCFWKARVPVSKLRESSVLVVRAMDEGLALMPRDMYWNFTGMMNNWWHRVAIHYDEAKGTLRFEHPTVAGNASGGWMERLKAEGQDVLHPIFEPSKADATVKSAESKAAAPPKVDDMEIMTDPTKVTTKITAQQLSEHANETDPWFVVNGHVFSGKEFLEEHPGGAESITLVAGEDATEDFMAIHSGDAKKKMRPFHIGRLDTDGAPLASQEEEKEDPNAPFLHPKKWKKSMLVGKEVLSHDSRIFRFALSHAEQEPGLPIGQHVYVRIKAKNTDGTEEEIVQRAYTPFSNNELKGFIDILIKVYSPCDSFPSGGRMSQLIDQLEVGSGSIELKGPLGGFTYLGNGQVRWRNVTRTVKNIACIAGGSGITPIYSTLKGIVDDGEHGAVNVWIVDANRTEADILARTHLDEIVERSAGRIRLWHILSGDCPPDWAMGKGRVSETLLRERLCPPPSAGAEDETLALVCGPPAMEKAVSEAMTAIGWDVERSVVFF